jgi:hypothetical protein
MNTRTNRFVALGLLTVLPLAAATLWLQWRRMLLAGDMFLYFAATGMAAKALGDFWYYAISPSRRHWLYLDRYLANDLLVHTRFVLPLAIAQAWIANQGYLFLPTLWHAVRPIWVSPLLGVVTWAINRYHVELAEEERYRPLGVGAAGMTGGRARRD